MTDHLATSSTVASPACTRPSPGDGHDRRMHALPAGRPPLPHVHWYRWAEHGPMGTLYVCRCGSVRPGF